MEHSHYESESELDDLQWDELCLNPYQNSFIMGKNEGYKAGLASGFKDGEAIGRSKALEIGIELGFYEGCLSFVIDHYLPALRQGREHPCTGVIMRNTQWNKEKVDKLTKGCASLFEAIKKFPNPDEIFRCTQFGTQTKEQVSFKIDKIEFGQIVDGIDSFNTEDTKMTEADIVGSLQRIRSKFKVFSILLKIPKFSLKGLMDQVTVPDDDEQVGKSNSSFLQPNEAINNEKENNETKHIIDKENENKPMGEDW